MYENQQLIVARPPAVCPTPCCLLRCPCCAALLPAEHRTDWVLGQFSEKIITARQRYRKFVAEGMAGKEQPWEKLVGQVFLGSEKFLARMQELLEDKRDIKEIPRSQRYPGRPPLNRLFADVQAGNRQQRNQWIAEAHIAYGYTLKEIADLLGVHYTTVSKAVTGRNEK